MVIILFLLIVIISVILHVSMNDYKSAIMLTSGIAIFISMVLLPSDSLIIIGYIMSGVYSGVISALVGLPFYLKRRHEEKKDIVRLPIIVYTDVNNSISSMIDNSIPKSEIFNELSNKYPNYSKDLLAKNISSQVYKEDKVKYRIPIYLLAVTILLNILFGISNFILYPPKSNLDLYLTIAILLWSFKILFLYGFLKYKLIFYSTAVILYTIYSPILLLILLSNRMKGSIFLELLLATFTWLFIHLLKSYIFPNINYWGKIKTDRYLDYIF